MSNRLCSDPLSSSDYFCLSQAELEKNSIPSQFVKRCICRSADVETPVFSSQDFDALSRSGKKVFILDVKDPGDKRISAYISQGIARGVNLKYLPSTRRPWCSMENKKPAPIFISTASRNGLKVVRNLADVNSLTTFHSVYMKPGFEDDVDLLFCYFLTPLAQDMLRENCKKLGTGLEKFQPNDVNDAFMIDLRRVTPEDRHRISVIYQGMTNTFDAGAVSRLADVFSPYFCASD